MRRQRLTWHQRGGADRRASAHPAYPDEGPASPAYLPDPEADAYENGDTSSWAEDPHPGPYPNSAHPAYPDEGPASPAYKAAKLRAILERKADRCLRLASAMMGPNTPRSVLEDQALSFMDLSDRAINASLARVAKKAEDDEVEEVEEEVVESKSKKARTIKALLSLVAGEDDDDDEEVEEEDEEEVVESKSKKAFRRRRAYGHDTEAMLEAMLAEEDHHGESMGYHAGDDTEAMLEAMLAEEDHHGEAMGYHAGDDDDDAEAMLEAMLAEEDLHGESMNHHAEDAEAEAMLHEMLAEGHGEAMDHHAEDAEAEAMLHEMLAEGHGDASPAEAMFDSEFDVVDPMGIVTETEVGLESDDQLLASLFGGKSASEDADEDEKKDSTKTARLRPKPKTASTGATRLGGGVIRKASTSDMDELSSIWESAPDVSKFF